MGVYYVGGISYSSDELYHHGIKGQKWGIRRFQNEDGSFTEEGKRHAAKYSKTDARTALGFGEKGHMNTIQKSLTGRYQKAIQKSAKYGMKGDKALSKGKDPSKYYDKGRSFLSRANAQKSMAAYYNSADVQTKARLNRAYVRQKFFGA